MQETMPTAEVSLPDKLDSEINQLVERGEFLNREQAVENLLSMGISVYDETDSTSEEPTEQVFNQKAEEQHDPAMDDGPSDDGYTF
jgi:Arc/MetJ-type ribon-helix-helix transcriptional regulator